MRWFKNLKKWQKGGIIGIAVGLIIACLLLFILNPSDYNSPGERLAYLHTILYVPALFIGWIVYGDLGGHIVDYIGAGTIVIFYGALGALFGRFQQIEKPTRKWVLTGLLALLLLLFYAAHYFIYYDIGNAR
jgi:hypothetical protein